jgi:hypothetical protein
MSSNILAYKTYFEKINKAYEITLLSACLCLFSSLSLLGNGLVATQQIQEQQQKNYWTLRFLYYLLAISSFRNF